MTNLELLKRVLQFTAPTAEKAIYELGAGGMHPDVPVPWNLNHKCDCSGFVSWCLGVSRFSKHPFYKQFNGGWINTDAIAADMKNPAGIFYQIKNPVEGAIMVFPSNKPLGINFGHVGIVTAVREKEILVTHCHAGNTGLNGSAISTTTSKIFTRPGLVIGWCSLIVVAPETTPEQTPMLLHL